MGLGALLLAGCGSSGSESGAARSTTTTRAADVTSTSARSSSTTVTTTTAAPTTTEVEPERSCLAADAVSSVVGVPVAATTPDGSTSSLVCLYKSETVDHAFWIFSVGLVESAEDRAEADADPFSSPDGWKNDNWDVQSEPRLGSEGFTASRAATSTGTSCNVKAGYLSVSVSWTTIDGSGTSGSSSDACERGVKLAVAAQQAWGLS